MIFKQWAAGDRTRLDSPYHIDGLRFAQAQQEPEKWKGYIEGHQELSTFGKIDDPAIMMDYIKESTALTREVLSTADGLFCTAASCGSGVLYEEEKSTGEVKYHYPAGTIIVDEAGTVQRPHLMIPIMAFPGAHRLVLAGDSKQLPAFVANPETKKWWPDCYLEKVRRPIIPRHLLHLLLAARLFSVYLK